MKIAIPCLYSDYGRYITRYRAFPYKIDCLKLVERRVLLSLYKVARKKLVKSAKIVGYTMGELHPHGDASIYGTLVNIVKNSMAVEEGNWGTPGLDDAPPAAPRYTETRLQPWVDNFAFKYLDYVKWENIEYANEPLALPSPIPLGLIGSGLITGIAFHRTLMPRYKLKDLAIRLEWLLRKGSTVQHDKLDSDLSEEQKEYYLGPKIAPCVHGCSVKEGGKDSVPNNDFYRILISGKGTIRTIPNGSIDKKKLIIQGRSPNSLFNSLRNACDNNIIEASIIDASKDSINIELIPAKRGVDLSTQAGAIWKKYLVKGFNINNIVCNDAGNIETLGVDDLLLNCFYHWRSAIFTKRLKDCENAFAKKVDSVIIQIIRNLISEFDCKSVMEIIDVFEKNKEQRKLSHITIEKYNPEIKNGWESYIQPITAEDIKKACEKSIRRLVEVKIDMNKHEQEILECKQAIINLDKDCFAEIQSLTK